MKLSDLKSWINRTSPALIFILLLVTFFILPMFSYASYSCGDITLYTSLPLRALNGDLPYRDFWQLYTPGNVYLGAMIYSLSGVNINALFIASILVSALIGAFAFVLARQILKDNFYALLVSVMVFSNGTIGWYESYRYMHVYLLFQIISAIFVFRYFEKKQIKDIFMSGLFLGIALFFRLHETAFAIAAFAISLAFFVHYENKSFSFSKTLRQFGVFVFGILVSAAILFASLIKIWPYFVKEALIDSLFHIAARDDSMYFTDTFYHLSQLSLTAGSFRFVFHFVGMIIVTLMYLLPFIALAAFYWYFKQKPSKSEFLIALMFMLWGLFTFPKVIIPVADHIAQIINPLFFVLAIILKKMSGLQLNKSSLKLSKALYCVLIISVIILLFPFMLFSRTSQSLIEAKYEVSTPHGYLRFTNQTEAQNVNNVVQYISNHTTQNDYIFSTPLCAPSFYALTDRKNPTYYDTLGDLIRRPDNEKQINICNSLLEKNAKIIIYTPEDLMITSAPLMVKCIEDNFKPAEKFGNYWIYTNPL